MINVATRRRSARRILRFDAVQRTAHWLNATLFGVLMFTAIPLYFGSFFGVVFPRHVIEMIHLWVGVSLPVPVLVSLAGPWGARMRSDLRRISVWSRDEVRWLRTVGREPIEADKFNPGQKANAIFTGAVIVIMLATGYVLQWFRFFPVSWRTGATFTHDAFALAIFVVVFGHVTFALANPASLKSMLGGEVDEEWAARHAPAWLDDVRAEASATGETAP